MAGRDCMVGYRQVLLEEAFRMEAFLVPGAEYNRGFRVRVAAFRMAAFRVAAEGLSLYLK